MAMRGKVSQAFLVLMLVSLLLLSYWAAARITEQGIEERFHSAVGLNQSGEDVEAQGGLPIETRNPLLYVIITLATLISAVTAYNFARRKSGG